MLTGTVFDLKNKHFHVFHKYYLRTHTFVFITTTYNSSNYSCTLQTRIFPTNNKLFYSEAFIRHQQDSLCKIIMQKPVIM